nr:hypothetical protein GCM10020185_73800 [Pseudomonas brassicacearum subsp. brassicacearum]
MDIEFVQQGIQLFHRAHVQAGDEAVVAGYLVAFGEFGDGLDLPLHFLQLPRQRADTHDGLELIAEALGVHLNGVAPEHATFFEPAKALGDTGGGQATEVCQGLEGTSGIFHQGTDEDLVNIVSHFNSIRRMCEVALIKKGQIAV